MHAARYLLSRGPQFRCDARDRPRPPDRSAGWPWASAWALQQQALPASHPGEQTDALLILADQWNARCFGPEGGFGGLQQTLTPQLDEGAAQGTRFPRADTQCPQCKAALRTLLTSLEQRDHGVRWNDAWDPPWIETLAHVLRGAGDRTATIGQHLPAMSAADRWARGRTRVRLAGRVPGERWSAPESLTGTHLAATLLSLDLPRGSHPRVRPTVTRAITRRAIGSRPVVSSSRREHGARSGGARSPRRAFRAWFVLRRRGVRRSLSLGPSARAPRESPALCAPACKRGGSSHFRSSPRPMRPRSNSRDSRPGNAGPCTSTPSRSAACDAGSRRSCGSAESRSQGLDPLGGALVRAIEDRWNGALARGQGSSSTGLR